MRRAASKPQRTHLAGGGPLAAISRELSGPGSSVVRVARALRTGAGHVVVTSRDVEQAEEAVDAAIESAAPYRVVRISATAEGQSVRDVLSSSIAALADDARSAGRSIVVVVADADLASAKQLERIRLDLEGAKAGIDLVRLVLIGCPVLSRILELPSARGLATRVGMRAML